MLDASDRTRLPIIISNLAEQYNIEQTTVKKIILDFNEYNKSQLLKGYEIDYIGICKVVPHPVVECPDETLACKCYKLANQYGYPRRIVYYVVKEYLNYLKQSILSGSIAEIRGICTIHPYDNCIHTNISLSLSQRINECDTLEKARVHTSKALKMESSSYDRKDA